MIFVKIGVQWDFCNYLSIIKIEFSWYLFEAHLVPRSELIVITTSTIFVDSESQKETISRYKATIRNFPRPANDHRIVSLPEEIGRAKPTCRRAGTCSARREFGDSGNRKWCFEAGAGLAEAALAEGAGTAPIVRAVSCYETRRASRERNGELPREEKMAEWREHRERERERERGSQTAVKQAQTQASFSPRSFPSASLRSSRVRATVCASSFLSFVAFLRAGLAQPGDRAESKPPYVPGRGPLAVGLLPRGLCPLLSSLQRPSSLPLLSLSPFSSLCSTSSRSSSSRSRQRSRPSPRRCREIATRLLSLVSGPTLTSGQTRAAEFSYGG